MPLLRVHSPDYRLRPARAPTYICKLLDVLGVSVNLVEFSSTLLLWLFIACYCREKMKESDNQMKTIKLTSIVFAPLLITSLFLIGVTASEYDPWYDFDDDGDIDIFDIVDIAARYGTTGAPINKTELLLELQARIDTLNATVISLKECIVVTDSIPYDGNGAYDSINGLSQDVSILIPAEFTLVAAVATSTYFSKSKNCTIHRV